ncbi:MAG: glycosyltransferase family 4 protein [Candidatus Aminicenantes bacterium]|nr:glycosyltransferase family 4 protein [Candidatus Aminicenantes bacterium]
MNRLKVLEMIDKPSLGGGQAVLLTLARHLDRTRFEVSVCAKSGGPLEDEVRKLGLAFHPAEFKKKPSTGLGRDLARLLASEKIDILHTHGGIAGLFGRRAARRARTPVVVHTIHGIHYLHYRNPILRKIFIGLERSLSRATSAVVCVSEADLAQARKYRLAPDDRLRLVRNGVAVVDPSPDSDRGRRIGELCPRLKLRAPVIGTVARLHRQKGVEYFIKASPEILRRNSGALFVVVGSGPLEKRLRAKIDRLGLADHFILAGERPDAIDLLSAFDIFVLPSLWEGLPLVLIEAAGLGKPIIATDIDGSREIIRDGETGLLVPPADPAALAGAVRRLLEDAALARRLGEKARHEIPPAFDLKRMVAETERLYLDLAAAKGL